MNKLLGSPSWSKHTVISTFSRLEAKGACFQDAYNSGFCTIRSQFAAPLNPHKTPEDINLCGLFYCEGAEMREGAEIKAVCGMEELPGGYSCRPFTPAGSTGQTASA